MNINNIKITVQLQFYYFLIYNKSKMYHTIFRYFRNYRLLPTENKLQ